MRKSFAFGMVGLCALALACSANASLINGDFETGNLTGWTVALTPNGNNLAQGAAMFDIDGPGPIAASYAGQFSAGKLVYAGANGGVEVTQVVQLVAGTAYRLHVDYAAANVDTNPSTGSIDNCGIFDLIVNGESYAHGVVGELEDGAIGYGVLNATFVAPTTGDYTFGARITREYRCSVYGGVPQLYQYVDNFYVPEPASLALVGLGMLVLRRR